MSERKKIREISRQIGWDLENLSAPLESRLCATCNDPNAPYHVAGLASCALECFWALSGANGRRCPRGDLRPALSYAELALDNFKRIFTVGE